MPIPAYIAFPNEYNLCACGTPKKKVSPHCRKCRSLSLKPPQDFNIYYIDMQECRRLPLTQNQYALVCISDYDWLVSYNWYAIWSKDMESFYAVRAANISEFPDWPSEKLPSGGYVRVWMHRQILGLRPLLIDPRKGDHANSSETLNNTRNNLRNATSSENGGNSKMPFDNSTGAKGVSWHKQRKRFVSRIRFQGRLYNLGEFKTLEPAAEAYKQAAIKFFGQFARWE